MDFDSVPDDVKCCAIIRTVVSEQVKRLTPPPEGSNFGGVLAAFLDMLRKDSTKRLLQENVDLGPILCRMSQATAGITPDGLLDAYIAKAISHYSLGLGDDGVREAIIDLCNVLLLEAGGHAAQSAGYVPVAKESLAPNIAKVLEMIQNAGLPVLQVYKRPE